MNTDFIVAECDVCGDGGKQETQEPQSDVAKAPHDCGKDMSREPDRSRAAMTATKR